MPRRLHRLKAKAVRGLKDGSGVVALEFVLTAPLLLFVVLGAVAMSLHFAILVALIHTASEGARASVGGLTDSERNTLAVASANSTFASYGGMLSGTAHATGADGPTPGTYQVTVTYDPPAAMGSFFNFWSIMFPSGAPSAPGQMTYTAVVANGGY